MKNISQLQFIKGIGPKRVSVFESLGFITPQDLLYNFPFDYLDRSKITKISDLEKFINSETELTVIGKLINIQTRRSRFKKNILILTVSDETGNLNCVFFNATHWQEKSFNIGDVLAFSSIVKKDNFGRFQFLHPEFDKLKSETEDDDINWYEKINTGGIVPKYHLNDKLKKVGIEQRQMRKIMKDLVLKYSSEVKEFLPRVLLNDRKLPELNFAISQLHFPDNIFLKDESLKRIKYNESFMFQMLVAFRKREFQNGNGNPFTVKGNLIESLKKNLQFELTQEQKKVINEIYSDLILFKPMHRLLQGDVGSGKTIVALFAILKAIENGFQVAFMAPTEILAEQHFHSFKKFLKNLNVNVRLLVGNQKKKLRTDILQDISQGTAQIVIGTHALIEENVKFLNLGFIVIDEQHRFGVAQRIKLYKKGKNVPHLLVMTATPIPRSLAMTIYGDLDISTINELPKGRKKIKTFLRNEIDKPKIYKFIIDKINQGFQAFIVVPLIEESLKSEFKSAINEFEKLKKSFFKGINIGLLHGRLSSDEKNLVMEKFEKNEIKLLVSTTVIEVGIDVPNAIIMLILDSEKYGLSQLHQLRGRIGRGSEESYCILISKDNFAKKSFENEQSLNSKRRLQTMIETTDGFKISEVDLELRGGGELFGTKQSGEEIFSFLNLKHDYEILIKTRDDVSQLILDDPFFARDENKLLKKYFEKKYSHLLQFSHSG